MIAPNKNNDEAPDDGGQGEILDPHHSRETLRMVERAARDNWPVTKELKQLCVDTVERHLKSGQPRTEAAAYRAAIQMDRTNIAREKPSGDDNSQHLHQHVHLSPVELVHVENFYGQAETDRIAESSPASIEGVA